MADSSSSPDFSELIHDLQIEIEEYGEDFVFLGFWKKARMNKEVLTGFMFQEDLDKADLQEGERVMPMCAADILAQFQKQQTSLHKQAK